MLTRVITSAPILTQIPPSVVWVLATTWWRHEMETFSALLAICAGNSPVIGEFLTQRPVTRSSGVFFDLRLYKRLSKQSLGWWFETPSRPLWRHGKEKKNIQNISRTIFWYPFASMYTLNIPDAWRVHQVFCICIDMFSKCSACVPCNHFCSVGEIWCSSWVWRVRQVFCDCTDMFSRSCFVCSCWYWCSTGNTGALPMPYASDLCSVTAQTCSPNVLLGAAFRHFHSHENTSVQCCVSCVPPRVL